MNISELSEFPEFPDLPALKEEKVYFKCESCDSANEPKYWWSRICESCIDESGEKYFLSKCCNKVLSISEKIDDGCKNCYFTCKCCGDWNWNSNKKICTLGNKEICDICAFYDTEENIICEKCSDKNNIFCYVCDEKNKRNIGPELFKCDCEKIVCENCSIVEDCNRWCKKCLLNNW